MATSVTIIVPGVPWNFLAGSAAEVASHFTALGFAGLISLSSPGGWLTWRQTYGVVAGVSAIADIARRLTSSHRHDDGIIAVFLAP